MKKSWKAFAVAGAVCIATVTGKPCYAEHAGQGAAATSASLQTQWADAAMVAEAAQLHPFDLQGRMKIAINALTSTIRPIPDGTYEPCGSCGFTFVAGGGLSDCRGRYTDGIWMIRSATDNHYNDAIARMHARNLKTMNWCPKLEEPRDSKASVPGGAIVPGGAHLPEVTRIPLGLISYYRATGDKQALESARELIHRFYELARKNDKYLWYPDFNYEWLDDQLLPQNVVALRRNKEASPKDVTRFDSEINDPKSFFTRPNGNQPAGMMGMIVMPAVRYYEETQDPVAKELVTKLCRTLVDYRPDFNKTLDHTHSNLATVSGVFMAGQVLEIPEFKAWAEKAYRDFSARDYLPDFGWVPETVERPRKEGLLWDETCATADYIEIAFELAQFQDERYWDKAERIAMNQLMESQMLRTDFMNRIPAEPKKYPAPPGSVTDHVLERSLGNFGIYVTPNDLIHIVPKEGPWNFGGCPISPLGSCCLGSGSRALYETWYYAAQEDDKAVRVNMQFSKRLPSAIIKSHMPGRAALDIEMPGGKRLLVRKPDWASEGKTRITVNEEEWKAKMTGTYFDFGKLKAGTRVWIEFPNELKTKHERIGEVEFTTVWRGNAVITIDPPGVIYPTYQGRERTDAVEPLAYVNAKAVNPL